MTNTDAGADTQAEAKEFMERSAFNREVQTHKRTNRTRGFVVPELPWHRDKNEDGDRCQPHSTA